jgi:hypothetical protein
MSSIKFHRRGAENALESTTEMRDKEFFKKLFEAVRVNKFTIILEHAEAVS